MATFVKHVSNTEILVSFPNPQALAISYHWTERERNRVWARFWSDMSPACAVLDATTT